MIDDYRSVRRTCAQVLSGHLPVSPSVLMQRLAERTDIAESADIYGDGGAVEELEQRVSALLGKPAALFFAKGMVAQMSALRVHADRAGSIAIALHPQSHFDVDELDALHRVAGLRPVRVGRHMPFGADELDQLDDALAAVTVELPLRRAGYLLPSWDALEGIALWCRARNVAFHIDGARIWEAAAAYGVAPAEIAALADSAYVSFYKGLGGLGGAVLVGDVDVIAAAKPWRSRFGGNLYTAYPLALTALEGLDRQLPRMPIYVERARNVADAIDRHGATILHRPTLVANAYQVILPGTASMLAERNLAFARNRGIWLFNGFTAAPLTGHCIGEIVVGDMSDHWSPSEAAQWLADFIAMT
jgi:threonine aldolase